MISKFLNAYNWIKYRLKKYPIQESQIGDNFYLVWLWFPTWIYEMEEAPTFPYNQIYSVQSYTDWNCWALRREGVFIGVQHESVDNIPKLIELGVIKP